MNEQEKDKLIALMRQADFHVERFDKRREYSWKIALGFWGAILGAATLLQNVTLTACEIYIGAGAIIVLHLIWLYGVFKADQKDKWVAFQCRDQSLEIINKSLKTPIEHPKPSNDRRFLEDWSVIFQILTTILLVIAISRIVPR